MKVDMMPVFETGRTAGALIADHDGQTLEKESETRIRRLTLDNDDLRIECLRLRSLLIASESEVLALRDHTARLQADLSSGRAHRPPGLERLARRLSLMLRRR